MSETKGPSPSDLIYVHMLAKKLAATYDDVHDIDGPRGSGTY